MHTFFRIGLLLLLGGPVLLTGCKKDEDDVTVDPNIEINSQLQGNWEVTSYTSDGVEYLGTIFQSLDMDFEKEGPSEGEVEMTLVDSEGSTLIETTDYTVRNNGKEIDLEDVMEFEIDLDGDDLQLEGIDEDGYRVVIKADRD